MSRRMMDPVLREAVRAELERLVDASAGAKDERSVRFGGAHAGTGNTRRAGAIATVVVVVVVLVAAVLALRVRHSTPPASPSPTPSATRALATTPLGTIVRTIPAIPASTSIRAGASDQALYVALAPKNDGVTQTLERIDVATGAITRRALRLNYLNQIVVGPDGLYLSTSVIKRFQDTPDTLMRLDPTTLRTLAVVHFAAKDARDGDVQVTASASAVIATVGDGTVARLNPRTLAVEKSVGLLTVDDLANGVLLSNPVIADGRVWILGANHGKSLVSFDGSTLRTITSTATGSTYSSLAAASPGVFLAGERIATVDPRGRLRVLETPGLDMNRVLDFTSVGTDLLVVPNTASSDVLLVSATGRERARLTLDSFYGGVTAIGPHTIWVTGVAGETGKITAIRITG